MIGRLIFHIIFAGALFLAEETVRVALSYLTFVVESRASIRSLTLGAYSENSVSHANAHETDAMVVRSSTTYVNYIHGAHSEPEAFIASSDISSVVSYEECGEMIEDFMDEDFADFFPEPVTGENVMDETDMQFPSQVGNLESDRHLQMGQDFGHITNNGGQAICTLCMEQKQDIGENLGSSQSEELVSRTPENACTAPLHFDEKKIQNAFTSAPETRLVEVSQDNCDSSIKNNEQYQNTKRGGKSDANTNKSVYNVSDGELVKEQQFPKESHEHFSQRKRKRQPIVEQMRSGKKLTLTEIPNQCIRNQGLFKTPVISTSKCGVCEGESESSIASTRFCRQEKGTRSRRKVVSLSEIPVGNQNRVSRSTVKSTQKVAELQRRKAASSRKKDNVTPPAVLQKKRAVTYKAGPSSSNTSEAVAGISHPQDGRRTSRRRKKARCTYPKRL